MVQDVYATAYPYQPRGGKARLLAEMSQEKIDLLPHAQRTELLKAKRFDDNAASRAMERRRMAFENYERICSSADLLRPELRGTAWAAWNALTEQENHREGNGNIPESILIGDRGQTMLRALTAVERV
jgi:hypothetical protein